MVPQLPKEVAEKYELTPKSFTSAGPVFDCGAFGVIDFSKLTLPLAASLVKRKAPFITEKPANTAAKTNSTSKE